MLIYGGKLGPQKRDQSGDLHGCEQGEEQYRAFLCALLRMWCWNTSDSCPYIQTHEEKLKGVTGSSWKLVQVACCEMCRVRSFSLSKVSQGLFNLMLDRAWCWLCLTVGGPGCSQWAAGEWEPCLVMCFLLPKSPILSTSTKTTFLPLSLLAKQIALQTIF